MHEHSSRAAFSAAPVSVSADNLSLPGRRDLQVRTLLALGGLGYAARALCAVLSVGSNDILTWERFADQIARDGVISQYLSDRSFNHPPLMGWLAYAVSLAAGATGIRFSLLFKLPAILADLGSGLILARIWERHDPHKSPTQSALVFALYGLSPLSILVSGYHGNTDTLCAMFALLAVYLAQYRRAFFLAGLALGAAINVKLIAVFCLPALFLSAPSTLRDLRSLIAGTSVGVIPFIPVLLLAAPEFYRNAIAYNSNHERWGITYLLDLLALEPMLTAFFRPLAFAYFFVIGRILTLLSVCVAAAAFGPTRRLSVLELVTLCLALFLIFAPGFGVQYLAYLAPLLFALSPWWGFRYSCVSGLFAAVVYITFLLGSTAPYFSFFSQPFRIGAVSFGVMTWFMLCGVARQLIARGVFRPAPERASFHP